MISIKDAKIAKTSIQDLGDIKFLAKEIEVV